MKNRLIPQIICCDVDAISIRMQEFRKPALASRLTGIVLILICLAFYAELSKAEISSETYKDMAQFCLSITEIDQIFGDFQEDAENPGYYNPIDGNNLDLKAVRQMRDNLQEAMKGKTSDPGNSFFFAYRGMFNLILGEDIKALGDFSEAMRLCDSAPVYPWLSVLYGDSGLNEHAVGIISSISCESDDDSLCDQKMFSLILLDEIDLADSISNQDFLWNRCIIRMIVDLLQNRKMQKHCNFTPDEISDLNKDDRFAYDVVTTGRLGEEHENSDDNADLREIEKYASFYLSLNLFQKGESDKGCDAINDVLGKV